MGEENIIKENPITKTIPFFQKTPIKVIPIITTKIIKINESIKNEAKNTPIIKLKRIKMNISGFSIKIF